MKNNSYYLKMNIIISLGALGVSNVLRLVNRTIFINYLSMVYLGYNGLFGNIFSVLSIAELGIGSTIIYALYKPYANQDYGKVNAYLRLYKNIYRIIFSVILGLGVITSFFLPQLIKRDEFLSDTYLIFFLFLLNSCLGYLFTYKRSLLIVKQKQYYLTIVQTGFSILNTALTFWVLQKTESFIYYLVIQIAMTLGTNVIILILSNKEGKEIFDAKMIPIEKEEIRDLQENIFGNFFSRIASVVVLSTDNILISYFINVVTIGIYSNYVLFGGLITTLVSSFTSPIMATIGNMIHTKTDEEIKDIFGRHLFFNFCLNMLMTLVFVAMINPFILLWAGEKFLLDMSIVLVVALNVFLYNSRQTLFLFINGFGLYKYEKPKAALEAILNLFLSIIFLKFFNMGLLGILLGTLLSTLLSPIWIEPIFVFKHGFKTRAWEYWKINGIYFGIYFISLSAVLFLNEVLLVNIEYSWPMFILMTLVNMTFVIVLIFLFNFKNKYFSDMITLVMKRLRLKR